MNTTDRNLFDSRFSTASLTDANETFQQKGYCIIRALADPALCSQMQMEVQGSVNPVQGPAEFEADTGYPGAPTTRDAPGGNTSRRLLNAYSRSNLFRQWALSQAVKYPLTTLMGTSKISLSQCHHNCVMTKQPGYSSVTSWHQDIRYWAFDRPELITVWLALSEEYQENGALSVIPGSHKLNLDSKRMDEARFLRTDLEENYSLLEQAESVELKAGDVLFFHSRLLHAAGMNKTKQMKVSLVFTYHSSDNHPTPNTRSSLLPSITL